MNRPAKETVLAPAIFAFSQAVTIQEPLSSLSLKNGPVTEAREENISCKAEQPFERVKLALTCTCDKEPLNHIYQ